MRVNGTRYMKPSTLLPLLMLTALLSLGLAISVGGTALAPDTVLAALLDGHDSVVREVILALRLPRALNAFSTGGLLAPAACSYEYCCASWPTLHAGISGGAALAALAVPLVLGSDRLGGGNGRTGATFLVLRSPTPRRLDSQRLLLAACGRLWLPRS